VAFKSFSSESPNHLTIYFYCAGRFGCKKTAGGKWRIDLRTEWYLVLKKKHE